MNTELKVSLIQTSLVWGNPIQNRINLEQKIRTINEKTDIVILPEMFTTGFSMNPDSLAENMNGITIDWMTKLANELDIAITGSIIIEENNLFRNRLIFVTPEGKIQHYDKRHTFTLAGEHEVYEAGKEKLVFDYLGWKICPLICYDLRFPVWARNAENYDLLLYVANWPKPRINAWDTLLKARAIENMSYCIGVNRVGLDANALEYSGHSACYDVLGNKISTIPANKEFIETVTLSKTHIKDYRSRLQFLQDQDRFSVSL
ncbi:amidohydrolase [Spongiivirga citrea]|uniref:Omega-amidase YafV n=1 Tax=Spongiivirga citrea TaxID=1481457 RepID=A0A6M0CM28_9FLAO|nr:amidohydrolase [Spongiivirga citrea]NER17084.1 amidohydrolase [Spongiivirga citrea]